MQNNFVSKIYQYFPVPPKNPFLPLYFEAKTKSTPNLNGL